MHLKQNFNIVFVPDYSIIGSAGLVKAMSITRTGTESVQPDCMIVTHFFRFVQDV